MSVAIATSVRPATRAAADQTRSDGLVPSEFEAWLDGQREKGRLLDYMEFEPPETRYPN